MDILAANDQENLAHTFQAGAAAKSLNAGLKGFAAKTPGNKAPRTPFKVPLNDENAVRKGGKSGLKTNGKGNESVFLTGKKGGKLEDNNAFVTPAGPRARAPLGMKTTNAKSKAFQTPAPLSASAKTQKLSPRLRRPKVKVHQPEVQEESEDEVPEVEYMPPKEIPLQDDFDDDMAPINWEFPQFKGDAMTRKYASIYHNPIEDDGRSRGQREFDEQLAKDIKDRKKASEEFDKLFADTMDKEDAEARRYLGIDPPREPVSKKAAPQKKHSGPSTLNARFAVAALSPQKPSYVAPTAATKSRALTTALPGRGMSQPAINPSASRNAAAVAASKSTIGYAQGRGTSTTARKPLSNVTRPPSSTMASRRPMTGSSLQNRTPNNSSSAKPRGAFSRSSSTSTNATLITPPQEEEPYRTAEDVENELRLMLLRDENEGEDDAWMNSFGNQVDVVDDEYADFQFQVPEGV